LSGVVFGESPRWHDGRLWFSDWNNRMHVALELEPLEPLEPLDHSNRRRRVPNAVAPSTSVKVNGQPSKTARAVR
jgi:hypothetical protein